MTILTVTFEILMEVCDARKRDRKEVSFGS